MDNVIRAIRVMDAHGDELTLFEYQQAVPVLAMIGLSRSGASTRFALDTGEEAQRVDDHTFVLVTTGETLARIP